MTVEVKGAKEVLRELRKIDPEARKQFGRDARKIVAPVVARAKAAYPDKYLSGMRYPWRSKSGRLLFPYTQAAARRGVKFRSNAGRKKNYVLAVTQTDPAASIIDMAGKAKRGLGISSDPGQRFIAQLTYAGGQPSRVMWPALEAETADISREIQKLLDDVAERTSRKIEYLP